MTDVLGIYLFYGINGRHGRLWSIFYHQKSVCGASFCLFERWKLGCGSSWM